jgi:hypothetical protein
MSTTTLFRPVGLYELALIWDAEMRQFPPRLPSQPIFYPVANIAYSRQIARDWNVHDPKSGFAGYVTSFDVDRDYLLSLEQHTVGSSEHVEYWVPADTLETFNQAICGSVRLEEAYFGHEFKGLIPEKFGLTGKDAVAQFVALHGAWQDSRFDFACEVSANRKCVFLNWLFWSGYDFSAFEITENQRDEILKALRKCWDLLQIAPHLRHIS